MPGNELLSVCCLGYRHAMYIKDCIMTIWQDSWPIKEIIAMDDGSGDGSVEALRQLQAESPCPFTVLEQEHTGNIPANFNRLFREARGDFVLFTSLDDMQLPQALEVRMERLLANDKCAFAVHAKGFAMETSRRLSPEITPIAGMDPAAAKALELERTQLHSFYIQGAVFRRSVIEAVHGFSENMIGDDIVLRTKIFFHLLAHPELSFSIIDEPGFIYRRHHGNVSRNVMRQIELALQYFDKFWRGSPYPKMIKNWLLEGLAVEPYDKIIRAFTFTDKAAVLLADADVQEALKINAVRSYMLEQENKGA